MEPPVYKNISKMFDVNEIKKNLLSRKIENKVILKEFQFFFFVMNLQINNYYFFG